MDGLLASGVNPTLGIVIFMLGGLAGAVFYLPFKKVIGWAWESYWLVYAVFGLVIVPWVLALTFSPNVFDVLRAAPRGELWYTYLCGAAWGFGGLTWGLMIRYLGFGLGLAMGAGLTSAAGTLFPPMLKGADAIREMFTTPSGLVSVLAALISLGGIVLVGMAGMSKEKELSDEEKKKAVAEFDFKKGIIAVLFAGLMSAGMSFGLQGGSKIEALALTIEPATSVTWKGMPVLVMVLLGGFTVNFFWCVLLNIKNKTAADYVRPEGPVLLSNLFFAALAGTIWCSQFICFKTGEPKMGQTSYVGWAVLMASQILFSQLLGVALGEWKGTSRKTIHLLVSGLVLLLVSAVVAGYSGYLGQG
ncbi:MAG: rhamnose/proton symporter RhaT [Planctomycetes bacterium]|jgi:L-rhamnose-H+ transport protein|nr:rhamnose/proton symporter RhaT [Planctomycetota bacterium]